MPAESPREAAPPDGSLEQRFERGEVVLFPEAPFALPTGPDRDLLLQQQVAELFHKNISFDPSTHRLTGNVAGGGAHDEERLREILADFAVRVRDWLAVRLPGYAGGLQADRVSYRPLEEATRRLRPTARNDLLHVDSFPNRPAVGRRILRVFANVNPVEPRIWLTADPFSRLLERYGPRVGLPRPGRPGWLVRPGGDGLGLLRPLQGNRTPYDAFMLRFHDFLKGCREFQERAAKKLWTFPPESVWLAMTDGCSYAELRGRHALEHSFFVRADVLSLPAEAPLNVLERACGELRRGRGAA